MATVAQLQEDRSKIAAKMKTIHESAEAEKRSFSTEDQGKWDGYAAKIEEYDARIERQKVIDAEQRETATHDEQLDREERQQREFRGREEDRPLTTYERSQALRYWALQHTSYRGKAEDQKLWKRMGIESTISDGEYAGAPAITLDHCYRGVSESGEELRAPRSVADVHSQAQRRQQITAEQRATNVVGTANLGGDTVPDEMMRPLEVALLAHGGMRQVSEILTTATGADLPMPSANDTAIEGIELAENTAASEQEVTFGTRTLKAYKYSTKMIPVSIELLQDSATNLPSLIGRLFGERIARITNRRFTVGTGSAQPEGIVTAAANSSVTLAAAVPTWQEMLSIVHSVDPAYREMGARFMFHDTTLQNIKKMADNQGRPIWLPSLIPGQPDTLHNYPYTVNNHMPTGSSAKGIIFGDLSKYTIREVRGLEILRLAERYAEFGRVAFLGFARYDGKLMDAGTGPVKYATLAA